MFSLKTPVEPKKLANISGYDTSSNEETAVTFFAGVAKIPLTWISPLYNLRSENVEQEGKKGAGGSSSQKKWFADISGAACYCPDDAPVDAVLYVLVNDEIAFTGPLPRVAATHYANITLDQYCQNGRVYWGTKDSSADDFILTPRAAPPSLIDYPDFDARNRRTWPRLDGAGTDMGSAPIPGVRDPLAGHYDRNPNYLNVCRFDWKQFFLGSSPNMPNVTVVLARGCKFFDGVRFEADVTGVNPIPFLYELLTDDLAGAAVLEISLDKPSWVATAAAMDTAGIKISPVLRSPTALRSFVADYLQYFDGWVRRNGSLLEIGHFTHGDIDSSGLLTLDDDDLVSEPTISPTTLDDTKNHVEVRFTNKDKWYNEDGQSFRDLANFLTVREKREKRFNMPFVIDDALALRFATEAGQMLSRVGGGSGSASFLRASVASLLIGDRFKLSSASFGLTMLLRVLGLELPADNEDVTKLSFAVELADWKHLYTQPPAIKDPDFTISVAPVEHAKIVAVPLALRNTPATIEEFAFLVEKPDDYVLGFRVFFSMDGITYDQLGDRQLGFAVWGRVKTTAYIDSTDDLDLSVGMVVELYGPDLETIVSQSDQQRDDNRLLLFAKNEPGRLEIMSVGEITSLGAGQWRIYLQRAIYDTIKLAHPIDEDVWFIYRSALVSVENANFVPGATVQFKLQPYTRTEAIDLADVAPIEVVIPATPPSELAPFGAKVTRTYSVDLGGGVFARHIVFTWDWTLGQDVASFDIAWRAAGVGVLLGDYTIINIAQAGVTIYDSQGVAQVMRQSYDLNAGPSIASYGIQIRAIDSAGTPSDWGTGLSRRAVSSTTPEPSGFKHFKSKADLEAYDVTAMNIDDIVFVTVNGTTQMRQLKSGAPAGATQWAVLAQSSMHWSKTL